MGEISTIWRAKCWSINFFFNSLKLIRTLKEQIKKKKKGQNPRKQGWKQYELKGGSNQLAEKQSRNNIGFQSQ